MHFSMRRLLIVRIRALAVPVPIHRTPPFQLERYVFKPVHIPPL